MKHDGNGKENVTIKISPHWLDLLLTLSYSPGSLCIRSFFCFNSPMSCCRSRCHPSLHFSEKIRPLLNHRKSGDTGEIYVNVIIRSHSFFFPICPLAPDLRPGPPSETNKIKQTILGKEQKQTQSHFNLKRNYLEPEQFKQI